MKRATWIAVVVFAVLLGFFLLTRDAPVSEGVKKFSVPTLDKTKVTKIEVSGAKAAVLEHDASGWKVGARGGALHPADDTQVQSLVDAFGDLKYGDVVTDRAERLAELEVDDAKGLRVKLSAEGAAPVELVFGKFAKGGTYVRAPGKNDVFIAQGRFPSVARRDPNGWRKRGVLALKPDEVTGLTLKPREGEPYALERGTDNAWALGKDVKAPAGFRFDPAAAQRIAQQLSSLSAQDFLDAPAPDALLGFAGAHDIVEAKLKDGKNVVVSVGQSVQVPTDGGAVEAGGPNAPIALKVEGDPQVYLVGQYLQKELGKPLTGLRDLSLVSFDPLKVKRLSIHGVKPVVVEKEGATWKVTDPKTLPAGADFDPNQVVTQLNRLKGIHATGLAVEGQPEAAQAFKKPLVVEVTLEDGKKETLEFGAAASKPVSPGKEVFVRGAVDKALYSIGEFEKTRFDTGVDLFKKPPPPPNFGGPGGGIKGLEQLPPDVRRQLEAQMRQRGGQGFPPGHP
jgi:hypothetical protein